MEREECLAFRCSPPSSRVGTEREQREQVEDHFSSIFYRGSPIRDDCDSESDSDSDSPVVAGLVGVEKQ